jgi:hypothetical protein
MNKDNLLLFNKKIFESHFLIRFEINRTFSIDYLFHSFLYEGQKGIKFLNIHN